MPKKKLTHEQFLDRCRNAHGDKYDYSKSIYEGNDKNILIICHDHGKFLQTPNTHFQGHGCPACSGKKRVTKEDFFKKIKKVHGSKYDYSNSVFTKRLKKIQIQCSIHGLFSQSPKSHMKGQGCPKCGDIKGSSKNRKTTKKFIEDSKKIHGNKYDYSKTIYRENSKTPVLIFCRKHKQFSQTPADHLKGAGCPHCWEERRGSFTLKSEDQFIKDAEKTHGKRYDYSQAGYINSANKVNIICDIHGMFSQNSQGHINGYGCPKCGISKRAEKARSSTSEFIKKAKKIHGDIYDYSLADYKSANSDIKIICEDHGIFTQKAYCHLFGQGCPKCKASNLEIKTRAVLEKYELEYEEQKRFDKCRYTNTLPFDFYLPSLNIAIECQGKQHYKQVGCWGGHAGFLNRNISDMIKKNYCYREGIKLIEIPYWKSTYEEICSILESV